MTTKLERLKLVLLYVSKVLLRQKLLLSRANTVTPVLLWNCIITVAFDVIKHYGCSYGIVVVISSYK